MSLTINAYQLRQAAEFAAPDYETEAEQRDTEVCLERMPAGTFNDGEERPAGVYVWLADYPEEGCMLLDEEPAALADARRAGAESPVPQARAQEQGAGKGSEGAEPASTLTKQLADPTVSLDQILRTLAAGGAGSKGEAA